MRRAAFFFSESWAGAAHGGGQRCYSPATRPADWIRSALGEMGRGSHGETHGPVSFDGEGIEVAGDKGYRGGCTSELEKKAAPVHGFDWALVGEHQWAMRKVSPRLIRSARDLRWLATVSSTAVATV